MIVVDESFALHITWTTYGSRLPGDERGYVSNTYVPGMGYQPKVNLPGEQVTADNAASRKRAADLQKWPTVYLTRAQAMVVARSLAETARRYGWRIRRAAIMTDHIHVVVMDCPDDGPAVRRVLKGNSQAKLSEFHGAPRVWFTARGSDRYKHGEIAIETAIQYVADQDNKLAEVIDTEVRECA